MIAFLQTYGFWIILIVLFFLMMRMHGGHGGHGGHGMGGGCGIGGMNHDQQGGHHQHTGGEPKSADQARVIPSNEGERDYYQPPQARVRDFSAQEEIEGRVEQPSAATQHVHNQ